MQATIGKLPLQTYITIPFGYAIFVHTYTYNLKTTGLIWTFYMHISNDFSTTGEVPSGFELHMS